MRNRLTKQAMGLNDSPTTMNAPYPNPPVEKYETGNPDSWAETPNMNRPWDEENAAGREQTGHPKMKTYASMIHEAKELEAKALRCLKMAELMLPEAPVDAIERQAVDFMTMSNKSVLATLRRIREFESNINEARVAKIVDAVLEVISEEEEEEEEKKCGAEEEEKEEEKKEASEEEEEEETKKANDDKDEDDEEKKIAAIVEAVLDVIAEEKEEEKEEEKKEEVKTEIAPAPMAPAMPTDNKIAAIVEAVLKVLAEEEEEKEEVKKAEDMAPPAPPVAPAPMAPEAPVAAPAEEKEEEKEEEKKEAAEEEKEEEKEEKEEAPKMGALEISFDDLHEVMASKEDEALLAQLFKASEEEEEEEEKKEEKKEAKIKTLKNVTASNGDNEISKLSSLWRKE